MATPMNNSKKWLSSKLCIAGMRSSSVSPGPFPDCGVLVSASTMGRSPPFEFNHRRPGAGAFCAEFIQ
jgi:hypothetical protein